MDFNTNEDGRIYLVRISFDGYGCCELKKQESAPLSKEYSTKLKSIIRNGIKNQNELLAIVKQAIRLNKERMWIDALEEYHLI